MILAAVVLNAGLWFIGMGIFSVAKELERANNRAEGKK